MRRRVFVAILGSSIVLGGVLLAQAPPPAAEVRDVTDTYFGQKVVDPYRWMEDTKSPEFASWLKAQNDYTRAVLAKIPGRAALAARIKALDDAGPTVSSVQWSDGRYFYFKTEPGSDNRKLFVRDRLEAPERLLLDTEKQSTKEKHYTIDYFTPSLDGRYVAAGVSAGGSENSVMEVIETATGKELPDRIDRAQFGAISWRKDGKSFYYTRLQKLSPDAPPTDKYLKIRVYLHTLGSNPDDEPAVFGFGVSGSIAVQPADASFVLQSTASPWAVAVIAHGVQNELTLYTAPADSVRGPATPWRKICGRRGRGHEPRPSRGHRLPAQPQGRVALSDPHDGPRTSRKQSGRARARFRRRHSQPRRRQRRALRSGPRRRDGPAAARRVRRRRGGGRRRSPFRERFRDSRPTRGSTAPSSRSRPGRSRLAGTPTTPAQRGLFDTKLVPRSPVDFSGIDSVEVKAKSADGTMVPLSIVFQKGLARDGSHPAYLAGYGAYGITYDPAFIPTGPRVARARWRPGDRPRARRRRVRRGLAPRRNARDQAAHDRRLHRLRRVPRRKQVHRACAPGRTRARAPAESPSAARSPEPPGTFRRGADPRRGLGLAPLGDDGVGARQHPRVRDREDRRGVQGPLGDGRLSARQGSHAVPGRSC